MKNWRAGETVVIECIGQRIEGAVIHASTNGRSLMLGFEAMIDGHVGMMPVLRDDDGRYRSIVNGVEVVLHEKKESQ